MTDYTNGNWHAVTLGQFIGLLVDAGTDPAVIMRVLEDEQVQKDGSFIRRLEILILPDGLVRETIERIEPESVHKLLVKLIQESVVR